MPHKFSWRSSYALPITFIIFFVLSFFLIGEQLPALSPYVFGPHEGDAIHILARAQADALHRPIAYVIIAIIVYVLFRFFSWILAWIIGATLWVIDQSFLVPQPPIEKITPAIVGFFGWGFITLGPYFLFRWVDKKWGEKGIWKAILILFLINFLLFGFFAFQILVLHKIFGDVHKNTQGQEQVDTTPRLPAKTCPDKMVEAEGKYTVAYWHGQTLEVAQKEQNWVEQNCPGVLEHPRGSEAPQTKVNPYLHVPCTSNPKPQFTHDLTEVDKILKITPTSLVASKMQDRVFLDIDTKKSTQLPIYAPVDADLVRGVYKISKTVETIDYDLHFQVSCEVWFFINHISVPIGKIKSQFPDKPATATNNLTSVSPPMHFKAGELIGYTTGTAQAHNFDFAVFDLNHTNTLIGGGGSGDLRFKNFICPFDLFPPALKSKYYQKLEPQLVAESNCLSNK